MKKETINTFDGGMIRDLHPLTTPNNVLTDALNATLITYNGNENILLNDIGNVLIKNALLKSGYVPVGMKEHGGIIYVAAYNPETKKGLVGSFPSPQQLWEDVNWSVNAPASIVNDASFSPTFYSGSFILVETVKLELFSTAEGPRIFHPGDKYIVGFPAKSSLDIIDAISVGNLDIQLGVVKSDGGIEIMKTWSKDSPDSSFLYDGVSNLSTYLGTRSIVQVFDASSSGSMILILNLHTLDSFNLLRDYSLVPNTTDKIQVTFTGEGQKDGVIYHSTDSNDYLRLCRTPQNSTTLSESGELQITISENNGKVLSFDIYPNVPFGVVKRMRRQFTIDFDKIRDNQDAFSEWRFFVTDKYVKIGWAYDFYNLDKTKELDYIKMYFHLLENGYIGPSNTGRGAVPSVTFQRENFNGNFEDYVNYSDIGLKYRNVYIVEIVKKFKDSNDEHIIKFKMLYLSKLYNSQYNGFYENKSIGNSAEAEQQGDIEFTTAPPASIKVEFKHELETNLIESKTKLLRPNSPKVDNVLALEPEISTADLKAGMYTTPTSAIEDLENLDSYLYLTQIKNKYGGVLKLKGYLEDLDDVYIGKPTTTLIKDILDTYSVTSVVITTLKTWNKSTELPDAFLAMNENLDPETVWDSGENNGTRTVTLLTNPTKTVSNDGILTTGLFEFDDYRVLQGRVSGIQSVTYNSKGLKPLYAPEYTGEKKRKIAPYWNPDSCLCIAGAGESENGTFYNTSILRDGKIIEGPDSGGGFDDGGLSTSSNYMGNPMTNIFTGTRGEEAELCFLDTHATNSSITTGWNFLNEGVEKDGPFLDYQGQNFMVACWRFTDGDTHLVNLMTPRDSRNSNVSKENYIKSTTAYPRLDVIMKCLLSLIFVVNKVTKKSEYVTTDNKFYRFQEGKTTVTITLSKGSTSTSNDIMVSDNNDDNKTLLWYLTKTWHFANDTITVSDSTYPMKNLIPLVNASFDNITITIEIPNYYDMDALSTYYFGSEYKYQDPNIDSLDIQAIYKLDIRNETLADNAAACKQSSNGKPLANIDGAYEWKDTPKCVPLTSTNKTLDIYRWDDASKIEFSNFYDHFKSKAKMEEWTEVPEDIDNEVYAQGSNAKPGWWTNADNEHAPDLYYDVLYSTLISALTPD